MNARAIEQAIYGSDGGRGYHFLARSPGFRDGWTVAAEKLCTGFGERPAGVACPLALFARPLGAGHVAVVHVADQGADAAGRPGALAFRLLVLPRALYADLGGDPFLVADKFPPPWSERGELPALAWEDGPPPARTVAQLARVLDVPYSATLLGGVQVLLDGGRLAFERTAPDPHLVRSLWALLPDRARAELWPATYTFANDHGFHVAVAPRANGPAYDHYVFEEQAGDYPEGRYELALQTAVEAGDQATLDALLARHSRAQVMRLGLILLAVLLLGMVLTALFVAPPARRAPPSRRASRAAAARLPAPEDCPRLDARERSALEKSLRTLTHRLGVPAPANFSEPELARTLQRIDDRLGTPDPGRDPGPLADLGPLQRQLRALLWKHAVPAHDDPRLNPAELVERLDEAVAERKIVPPAARGGGEWEGGR